MSDAARLPGASADRWPRVRELVDAALALSPDTRPEFIDRACGTDDILRSEVSAQVDACERAAQSASFLDKPASAFAAVLLGETNAPWTVGGGDSSSGDEVVARLRSSLSGRYDVERELGRGGMATVYLARDLRHERRVAIKVVNPALGVALSAERFLREIGVTARLTHPHILPLHDSGEADGLLYYVMPYVEGETLRDRLSEGPMSVEATSRLIREVASALAYAHRNGVVHRDVKPANILLADGHAVVADFGIARAVRRAHERGAGGAGDAGVTLTDIGMSLGTPAYMAPEQAVGDASVDHRADIYAFGVVAYEAFAGKHPFGVRPAAAMVAAHLSEAPPAIETHRPDLPADLAAVVMKCLEKDPAARPQSADEIVAALDAVRPSPSASDASGAARAAVTRPRPARRIIVAGVVGVLLVVAVLAELLRPGRGVATARDAATTAAASMRTVAVLPFENTDGVAADEYFSDGLTDELAHALANLPGLHVAGRTSTFAFKHKSVSAQEMGRSLGVGAIITGDVRRSADRLRVTAQLVSTADGKVVLDSLFEGRSGEVFRVQDDLTRSMVGALTPALGGHPAAAFATASARGTTDTEAYYLYLKGRYYWLERGRENVARAILCFRQAIGRDSTFARAYAGLAMAYDVLSPYVVDPTDSATALTAAAAAHAMALDSTLADSHLALALARDREMRFADAIPSYRRTLIMEPSNQYAHHAYGLMLVFMGRTDEGIAELRQAAQLDPLAKSAGTALVLGYVAARQFPAAIAESRRVLAFDSTFSLGLHVLGTAQIFAGQPDSAVRTLERHERLYPERGGTRALLVLAYAASGRWTDAARVRRELHAPDGDRSGGVEAAFADFVFGDREPLVKLLMTAAGRRSWNNNLSGFGCNPLIDPLWSDARFRATMHDLAIDPCVLVRPWPIAPPG